MMRFFQATMRRMPEILTAFAVIFYVTTVFIAIVSGNEFSDAMGMPIPAEIKLKAFLIVFVQPIVPAVVTLFGAALLWRVDKCIANGFGKGVSE